MDRDWDPSTPAGLRAILDRPRASIARACAAVEQCLAINRDNSREFFEVAFPTLLKRLFGLDCGAWLTNLSWDRGDADLAALRRLLNPSGSLFEAMRAADADGSTRFLFPRERLPPHTQLLLGSAAGRDALARWPQYGPAAVVPDATGRAAVHVGVLQYYLAWFVFYAYRGGLGPGAGGEGWGAWPADAPPGSQSYGDGLLPVHMRRAVSDALHLHPFRQGGHRGDDRHDAYLLLLSDLLSELLPPAPSGGAPATAGPAPGGGPLPTPFAPWTDGVAAVRGGGETLPANAALGQLFLGTMIEFWLLDGDEPLPGSAVSTSSNGDTITGGWVSTYDAPSEEVLHALCVLTRHVAGCTAGPIRGTSQPALRLGQQQAGATVAPRGSRYDPLTVPCLPPFPARAPSPPVVVPGLGAEGLLGNQAFARRLYRFLHRALRHWPPERSTLGLTRLLLAAAAPWTPDPLAKSGAGAQFARGGAGSNPSTTTHLLSSPRALAAPLLGAVQGAQAATGHSLLHGFATELSVLGGGAGATAPATPVEDTFASSGGAAHVLAALPFYSVLVPLFLETAPRRLEARGAKAARDVNLALAPLASSPSLRSWVGAAEAAAAAAAAPGRGASRRRAGALPAPHLAELDPGAAAWLEEAGPWLAVRGTDWETSANACCTPASGPDSRGGAERTADSPRPAPRVLPTLLHAFPGAEAGAADGPHRHAPPGLQPLELAIRELVLVGDQVLPASGAAQLRACLGTVFGLHEALEDGGGRRGDAGAAAGSPLTAVEMTAADGWLRLPKCSWRDARPKGDPLLAPLGSWEIGWLVHILVWLSLQLDWALGLTAARQAAAAQEAPETRWQELTAAAVHRGVRINLRPMADVRNLGWAPVVLLAMYLLAQGMLALGRLALQPGTVP